MVTTVPTARRIIVLTEFGRVHLSKVIRHFSSNKKDIVGESGSRASTLGMLYSTILGMDARVGSDLEGCFHKGPLQCLA